MTQTTQSQDVRDDECTGRSKPAPPARVLAVVTFMLLLCALWALTHRYHGFARDGALYAFQALAEIQPSLKADLYLQSTSQDHYTVFSPIYAYFIRIFGLQSGELILFAVCQVAFYGAAGMAARELSGRNTAWLCVALLIITTGYYGAYEIFSYAENYLSARSLGEAMVVAALAFQLRGRRWLALGTAALAMLIHPLMALPGILLLLCLNWPLRVAIIAMVAGVLAAWVLSFLAVHSGAGGHFLTLIDPAWLEVVLERSQFLFLQYWGRGDWEIAVRPILCLSLSALVLPDERARRLCVAALLVGLAGLAVALIAGTVGPVAILLQGQAWRWMWVTGFISVLLVVPTMLELWRDDRSGPLCAVLLLVAWTFPEVDGLASAATALALWLVRRHVAGRSANLLRWAAQAIGVIVVIWILAHAWTYLHGSVPESGREPLVIARSREIFGLGISAASFAGLVFLLIERTRSKYVLACIAVALLAASILVMPGSVKQMDGTGTRADIEDFEDWRRAIPPESNVLIVPTRNSAAFFWFTLNRPSYLTVDQSAGVIFSPVTAQEVRRRSEVLLPVEEPDWRILTKRSRHKQDTHNQQPAPPPPPLTVPKLEAICSDPALGFVIAKENLGFDPVRHVHRGSLQNWNLYDCRHVRAEGRAT